MNNKLINGDCLEELKKLDDNSVDLLCTDPPYGYGFMGRDWDKVLPDIKIFEECFRVLKPGSMAFVMSAPRSDVQYRMAEMLEKVGFKIDYTPIYWTYASGFPKAMNIGKMIDKRDGNDREVIGVDKNSAPDLRDVGKKSKEAIGIDKLSYGQVENAERLEYEQNTDGRFPANLLVSDDILEDGKIRTAKPHGGDGKPLDTRDMGWGFKRMASSISDSGGYSRYYSLDAWFEKNLKSLPEPVQQTFPFMIVPKASRSEKDNGLEFMEEKKSGAYVGRGGSQEDPNGMFKDRETKSRNIHPTVKPLTLMNYLVVLGSRKGDVVLEPFAGSGTTALACVSQERDYIAIEREEEYYEIAKARLEKVEEPIKLWEKFSG